MQWQTLAGFAFVILGVAFILLGTYIRSQLAFAPTRHIIAWLAGVMEICFGISLLTELRPPLFGMPIAAAETIGVMAVCLLLIDSVACALFLAIYHPNLAAGLGIPPKLREWIFGDSLPERLLARDTDTTIDRETHPHA